MERLVKTLCPEAAPTAAELFRLMQDIAGEDATRREGGQSLLLSHGCTWVLVKMRVQIARMPAAGEELCLSTWPLRGRLGLYPRAYEMWTPRGEKLVRAESMWAIMDVQSRGMISGESRGIVMLGVEEGRLSPMRRLTVPEGGQLWDLTPAPEQIDENGHMNNAAYLDAVAAMLPEELRGRELRAISVDYEHEILPGRHAQVRAVREGETCFFEGSMEDKVCFRLSESFAI